MNKSEYMAFILRKFHVALMWVRSSRKRRCLLPLWEAVEQHAELHLESIERNKRCHLMRALEP